MFLCSIIGLIGYLVGFFMMLNSVQKAKNGEILLWTGDLSKTVELYQKRKVCDKEAFDSPGFVQTWFVFSFLMTVTVVVLRVFTIKMFSGMAFTQDRNLKVRKAAFTGAIMMIGTDLIEGLKFIIGRSVLMKYEITRYELTNTGDESVSNVITSSEDLGELVSNVIVCVP